MRRSGLAICIVLGVACSSRATVPAPRTPIVPTPVADFRRSPPPLPPLQPIEAPDIHRTQLNNDLTILVVEEQSRPLVEIAYVSRRAGLYSNETRTGLTPLALDLLAEQVNEDAAAITLYEAGGVAVTSLAEDANEVLISLCQALKSPGYDPADVAAARNRQADRALTAPNEPSTAARNQARRRLYGRDHPAGTPSIGLPTQIQRLRAAHIVAYHQTRLAPEHASVIVVGDVDANEVTQLLTAQLNDWRVPEPPTHRRPTPPIALQLRDEIHLLGRHGFQAHIALAFSAPGASTQEVVALDVLAGIVAGG